MGLMKKIAVGVGKLLYLSDEEVKSELSFRKAFTKSAANKIVNKI